MSDTHIYLKFNDEKDAGGESSTGGREDVLYGQIEVESLSWGMSGKTENRGSDSKGQVKFNEVTLGKIFDLATTRVMNAIKDQHRGQQGKKVAFDKISILYADVVLDPRGDMRLVPVLEYTLNECYVSSISVQCQGSGKSLSVTEEFKVSFTGISVDYHPPGSDDDKRTVDRAHRKRVISFASTSAGTPG